MKNFIYVNILNIMDIICIFLLFWDILSYICIYIRIFYIFSRYITHILYIFRYISYFFGELIFCISGKNKNFGTGAYNWISTVIEAFIERGQQATMIFMFEKKMVLSLTKKIMQ